MKKIIINILFLYLISINLVHSETKSKELDFFFNCNNYDSLFNSEFFSRAELYYDKKDGMINFFKSCKFKVEDFVNIELFKSDTITNDVYIIGFYVDSIINNANPKFTKDFIKSNILILSKINNHWFFNGLIFEGFDKVDNILLNSFSNAYDDIYDLLSNKNKTVELINKNNKYLYNQDLNFKNNNFNINNIQIDFNNLVLMSDIKLGRISKEDSKLVPFIRKIIFKFNSYTINVIYSSKDSKKWYLTNIEFVNLKNKNTDIDPNVESIE